LKNISQTWKMNAVKTSTIVSGEPLPVAVWRLPHRQWLSALGVLWQLSKPRVTLLVWLSALAAMLLELSLLTASVFVCTAIGVWLIVASANGFNQVQEWRYDARMPRTAHRPIPSGKLSTRSAAAISALWGTSGVVVLWLGANPLTAQLGLFALLTYVLVYTPLKRVSAWCTAVGAVPGAIPPVMGWTAIHATLGAEAFFLFLMQYLWQFPHFWAIAWKYRDDYREAGFRMLPFDDDRGTRLSKWVLAFAIMTVLVSFTPSLIGWRSVWYAVGVGSLGWWNLRSAFAFARQPSSQTARTVMLASLGYLPAWFLWFILSP
jgi:protoheme IX farnesyltransferase